MKSFRTVENDTIEEVSYLAKEINNMCLLGTT